MRVGILTGGGDCPGLNAVIRAVVKRGLQFDFEFVGIRDGWGGLVEKSTIELSNEAVSGILPVGGTILGTSRTNPYKTEGDVDKVKANLKELGIDALICIGGDDTLGVASKLYDEGIHTIGVPKTIDNDLSATDFTFGFDTAVSIVTWALDRLHTTTEAHHRVMVVEVMGRQAGWIAVYGGLAGGADVILIPEKPVDPDEVCKYIEKRKAKGKHFSLVVAAEGAQLKEGTGIMTKDDSTDAFGHAKLGGIGEFLAREIEAKTGLESRHVVLGHLQRGGTPTSFDRILATRFGVRAVELVDEGKFGQMVALQGNAIVDVSLHEATSKTKTVDMEMYKTASVFFG
ncbi:MAG: 6-phosphofructokinase [Proteobacteria bacterium]|nr:6-phosphofructokinase [Pseudomonadota bacterium]